MKRYFIIIVMLAIGCISSTNAQQVQPVTLSDVKALVNAGLSDEIVINQIRITKTIYHLKTADIIDLKNSKVSEKIIDFMINTATQVQPTPAATQSQTAQPAQPAEMVSEVEVPQPVVGADFVVVPPGMDYYVWPDNVDVVFWGGYYWGRHSDHWNRSFHPPAYGNPVYRNPGPGSPGYRNPGTGNPGAGNPNSGNQGHGNPGPANGSSRSSTHRDDRQ